MALTNRPSKGYCVIRVEAEKRGLLIVLLLNLDAHQSSTERTRKTKNVAEAVAIVRRFLEEFVTSDTKQSE
jgi:hypothetical protein